MALSSLQKSISACRGLTRQSQSNFVPAFSRLPAHKREAMEILYAYTRFTDDLVDLPDRDPKTGQAVLASPRRQRQKLNQWVAAVKATVGSLDGLAPRATGPDDTDTFQAMGQDFPGCDGLAYLPALRMIVDRFEIPREPLFHLIEGVGADIEPRRFETFDDCAEYCHLVATSVGCASLAIWGTTEQMFSPKIVHAAKACGIAFQWTNILRDLLEDYRNGRIYLPMNELTRTGLTENQFGSLLERKSWNEQKKKPEDADQHNEYAHADMIRRMDAFESKFDKLILAQIHRCEIYYANAAPLYNYINRDSRKVFGMMWSHYYQLFNKIKRKPILLTRGRVQLSALQKLRLYLCWRLLPCRQLTTKVHDC